MERSGASMLSLWLTAVGRLEVQPMAAPAPAPGEVLVRVRAAGVCGSDLHAYAHPRPGMVPPLVLGHECAGEVVATGAAADAGLVGRAAALVPTVACGACPFCLGGESNICPQRRVIGMDRPGGFAEYVCVPAENAVPLPDGFPWPRAGVVEPVAVVRHLFDRLPTAPPDMVAILGAGFLGLVAIQMARHGGAGTIVVADVRPERLAQARDLGADVVVNSREVDPVSAVVQASGGQGAALVVEAAGVTSTRRQAVDMARPGGTIGLLGLADAESPLDFVQLVRKELRLIASYSSTRQDFSQAIDMMAAGHLAIDPLLETYALREGPDLFARLAHGSDTLKAVLQPGG